MYFRARYYSPQLGQFISRDPLGYVDGMSQYRAYFVPGGMDPQGLVAVATPIIPCVSIGLSIDIEATRPTRGAGQGIAERIILSAVTGVLKDKLGLPKEIDLNSPCFDGVCCHRFIDTTIYSIVAVAKIRKPNGRNALVTVMLRAEFSKKIGNCQAKECFCPKPIRNSRVMAIKIKKLIDLTNFQVGEQ